MGGCSIEDYSERAIAVFGDTQPYKEVLSALGGKFNPGLKGLTSDTKRAGWVFPKGKKADVLAKISQPPPAPSTTAASTSESSSSTTQATSSSYKSTSYSGDDRVGKLEKLVHSLTSRLEAVESELAASRKPKIGNLPSTIASTPAPATTTSTKRSWADDDDEEEMDDDDEPVKPSVSLIQRNKPKAKK